MKKELLIRIFVFINFFFILLISCRSNKNLSNISEASKTGSVELEIPFKGEAYRTSSTHFRASQSGISPDPATARKIALINARTALAAEISTTIRSVIEIFSEQLQIGNTVEFNDRFQEITHQVIDQELSLARIIDEKVFKRPDGLFECWVAVEMSAADLNNKINNRISLDDRLRQNYNSDRFRNIFEEELGRRR